MVRHSLLAVVAAATMVAFCASPASAQVKGLGRVTGQIVDESGAAMAGVELSTATMDGSPITAKSDGGGNWMLVGLGRGEWNVLIKKDGYTAKRVKLLIEKELDANKPIKISLTKA